jgi:HPt (histidine-containing phosphotransfer) domain-containing protein
MSLDVFSPTIQLDLNATLANLNGDAELLQAIAQIFAEDVPSIVQALKHAFATGDGVGSVLHAHTIKGMALNFRAEPLTTLSRGLETDYAKLSNCEREVLVLQIESACNKTLTELKREIGLN